MLPSSSFSKATAFLLLLMITACHCTHHSKRLRMRFSDDDAFFANIHLKTDLHCEKEAMKINADISAIDKSQQINFVSVSQPHITLYLTAFNRSHLEDVYKGIENAVKNFEACAISTYASLECTQYSLWNNTINSCLRYMSDKIVNETKAFVHPDAKSKIPPWVYQSPIKEQLIENIHHYGSPNVFNTFNPHITVGFSVNKDVGVKACETVRQHLKPCTFGAQMVAISPVGKYGTVPRHSDLKQYEFGKL